MRLSCLLRRRNRLRAKIERLRSRLTAMEAKISRARARYKGQRITAKQRSVA